MRDPLAFNERLHQQIRDGIHNGTIQVAAESSTPTDEQLPELIAENLKAGRPLLEGLKVYRGSKDPDVNASSFEAAFKHAAPSFYRARGYAETANQHIGFACKETYGLGMLAEYELPPDAIFTKNFGLESLGLDGGGTSESLTVAEAEGQLLPLAEAYVMAGNEAQRSDARRAISAFEQSYMYEVAIPAKQSPTQQWVVQHGERESNLLLHQNRGALADVMIEVVKERKAAIDEHTPSRAVAYLRSLATKADILDVLAPGTAQALQSTTGVIQGTLTTLRRSTADVSFESLSDAIEWRRSEQRGLKLSRLGNSGMSIEHDHAQLSTIPALLDAGRAIEVAALREAGRAERDAAAVLFEAGHAAADARERHRQELSQCADTERKLQSGVDNAKRAKTEITDRLDLAERQHAAQRNGSFLSRLRYRFGGQSVALAEIASLGEHAAALDKHVTNVAAEWENAGAKLKEAQQLGADLAAESRSLEGDFLQLLEDGRVPFLHPDLRQRQANLSLDQWDKLKTATAAAQIEAEGAISVGRQAAQLFQGIERHGLEVAVARHLLQTGAPEQVGRFVDAAAQKGVVVDPKQLEQAIQGGGPDHALLIVGKVAHIDSATRLAVIHVGRGIGMPVRLDDLGPQGSLEEGEVVELRSKDGKLQNLAPDSRAVGVTR